MAEEHGQSDLLPGQLQNNDPDPKLKPADLDKESQLYRSARAILTRRKLRAQEFPSALFGEPAWDMLLELFVRAASGVGCTVTQLDADLDVPQSSSVRWLKYLERSGLIVCRRHPTDHGAEFVELTPEARDAIGRYLAATQKL